MISSNDRALIRGLLLEATNRLIEETSYPTMHTIATDLPPKALVKYRFIAQMFMNHGYKVRTKENRGQHIWWFERTTE
jgi:hypothetical protein